MMKATILSALFVANRPNFFTLELDTYFMENANLEEMQKKHQVRNNLFEGYPASETKQIY